MAQSFKVPSILGAFMFMSAGGHLHCEYRGCVYHTARMSRQDPDDRMDQIVGILIHIVLDVIVRASGRNIRRFVGLHDRSERAELIVGSMFWSAAALAAFIGIRSLT